MLPRRLAAFSRHPGVARGAAELVAGLALVSDRRPHPDARNLVSSEHAPESPDGLPNPSSRPWLNSGPVLEGGPLMLARAAAARPRDALDRKSTRLNSSHANISY